MDLRLSAASHRPPRDLATLERVLRRDAILGTVTEAAPDACHAHFRDLDPGGLAALVHEALIDPAEHEAAGPEFFALWTFTRTWPEARIHGHVRRPSDVDARIVFEGVEIDLWHFSPERRAAARLEFAQAFADADQYFSEPDWLYAWWERAADQPSSTRSEPRTTP